MLKPNVKGFSWFHELRHSPSVYDSRIVHLNKIILVVSVFVNVLGFVGNIEEEDYTMRKETNNTAKRKVIIISCNTFRYGIITRTVKSVDCVPRKIIDRNMVPSIPYSYRSNLFRIYKTDATSLQSVSIKLLRVYLSVSLQRL